MIGHGGYPMGLGTSSDVSDSVFMAVCGHTRVRLARRQSVFGSANNQRVCVCAGSGRLAGVDLKFRVYWMRWGKDAQKSWGPLDLVRSEVGQPPA